MIFFPLGLESQWKANIDSKEAKFPLALVNNVFKEGTTIKDKIDMAVFPALQGGPHNHQIGALAVQLAEVNTPGFTQYIAQVVENSKALGEALQAAENGPFKLVSGGTDTHLVLADCVSSYGINGRKLEKVCDLAGITLNKNTIPGDTNALSPSGVRIGACAMTTRGCTTEDMKTIASFIARAARIARSVQDVKGKKIKDFEDGLDSHAEIIVLKGECTAWASKFVYPGV